MSVLDYNGLTTLVTQIKNYLTAPHISYSPSTLISGVSISTVKEGIDSNQNSIKYLYGSCSTAAATLKKEVTIPLQINSLVTGITIFVKFTNSNSISSPTLQINGSTNTNKSIVRYGSTTAGTTEATSWRAGEVVGFTYDGTNWVMHNNYQNTIQSVNSSTGNVITHIKVTSPNASSSFTAVSSSASDYDANYPYRASIVVSGGLSTDIPVVNFTASQIGEEIYAPYSNSYNGGVYIYANEAHAAITVGSIILHR